MPKRSPSLDQVFHCLANPARRAVVERLGRAPATMTELAEPFDMAMPSLLQHLRLLEETGLVTSEKKGRVRTYQLNPPAFFAAETWLDQRRRDWNQRLDQLDDLLNQLNGEDNS